MKMENINIKPKSDIYDTLTYGIVFAGFGVAAYGMHQDVNIPLVAGGLGAGIIAGSINFIRQGFESRKKQGPKLEEMFI